MPTKEHTDSKGNYYSWGNSGAHYYFNNPIQKIEAKNKANKQAEAIYAHGYKGGELTEKQLEEKFKHYGIFSKILKKYHNREKNPKWYANGLAEFLNLVGLGKNNMKSEKQNIIFRKENGWTIPKAKKWMKEHNLNPIINQYRTYINTKIKSEIRFRLTDPEKYNHFTTLELGDGISSVLGWY